MSSTPAIEKLLATAPYGLPQTEKRTILTERLRDLTRHHYERCESYRNLIDRIFGGSRALEFDSLEEAPFVPVSLFKTRELRSVPASAIVKTLTSSGTTGQAVSRIHLDAATAQLQSRTLVKIMQHFLGVERRPMVFLDHSAIVRDRRSFSARGAGIMGMLPFGRQPFYALREDMSLDVEGLQAYLQKTRDQSPVFFGFTYMVWQYFVEVLEKTDLRFFLPEAVLLHSGGWKRMESLKVSQTEFRRRLLAAAGI
jgi:hypothetical protein